MRDLDDVSSGLARMVSTHTYFFFFFFRGGGVKAHNKKTK